MNSDSIVNLLENKIVLIVPADSDTDLSSFEEVATDKVTMIGLGEPESVPVGQYSEEVFTSLNILDAVKAKANYGSDVRTVLSWVETSAVDCGIVYATDAYTSENVKIVAEAPEGSCKQVIYPAGVVKASENADAAEAFVEYLQTEDTLTLFESYGFSRVE
jgi:molybdate transport system substrate-binding protein